MKKTWTSKKKKNKNTLVNLKGEVKIRCWVRATPAMIQIHSLSLLIDSKIEIIAPAVLQNHSLSLLNSHFATIVFHKWKAIVPLQKIKKLFPIPAYVPTYLSFIFYFLFSLPSLFLSVLSILHSLLFAIHSLLIFCWFSAWAWVLLVGFSRFCQLGLIGFCRLGFVAWVWVHGVVVVDSLGLGLGWRCGGWKRAWVCRSRPVLVDLGLGWLCSTSLSEKINKELLASRF